MFSSLIGNDDVKTTLRRLLSNQRLPGSLLFTGPEGIGKKMFALELAKALNCRNRQGVEACDECSSCKRIANSTFPPFGDPIEDKRRMIWSEHPDLAMVRPYKQIIRVKPIRELEGEANFRPFEGALRVFIIEDADYMNDEAANALLKTLEEPTPTTHLVLTSTNPSSLLATIRSRCQTIRFAPIAAGEIEQFLLEVEDIPKRDAEFLALTSCGSLGRALATDVDVSRERRDAMLAVLRALTVTGDRVQLLRAAEGLAAVRDREEYEQLLELLEVLIRDAWALNLGRPREAIVNQDLSGELEEIAREIRSERVQSWLTQIEELRGALEVNLNRKITSDALLLSMAAGGGTGLHWKI